MSDNLPGDPGMVGPQSLDEVTLESNRELVGRGLLLSLGGVIVGVVLTAIIWKMGFVASVAGFVMALGCVKLYELGAGHTPRSGAIPLLGVIVAGAVLSMLSVVVVDALDYYDRAPADIVLGFGKWEFVRAAITNGDVLKDYLKTFGMMALFTGLGAFSTMRGLMRGSANH